MTTIRLDAATIEKLRAVEGGRVILCDESGKPVRTCLMFDPKTLDGEPDLTDEEWERREQEEETFTTAQILETLRRLGSP